MTSHDAGRGVDGVSEEPPRRRSRRRARTDTVFQLEAAECGAASLAMVLSHFGLRVPLEELRLACGVSRDGSKASGILRAAESYGLIGTGLSAEPAHLRELAMPQIAFVNFNHFLVIEGISRRHAWLNDPAHGPRRVTLEELDEMFSGVVLVFEPGPDFRAADTRPSRLRSLRERLRGYETAVFFVFLASLALVLPGLVTPALSRIFVDYVLVQSLDDWMGPLALGLAITALARFVLSELQAQTLLRAETRLATQGSSSVLWRLLRLPAAFFSQRFAGEVASRLDLGDELARVLTGELARAALAVLTAVFFLVVMVVYNPLLAAVGAGFAALNVVVLLVVARRLRDRWQKTSVNDAKLHAAVVAGLQDVETFKAAGAEDALFRRWAGLHASVVDTEQRLGMSLGVLNAAPALLQGLASAALLVLGGLEIMDGRMTIGMLVAFQTLQASFAAPLAELTGFGTQLQQLQAFLARLDDVDGQPIDARFSADDTPRPVDRLPDGQVSVRGLSFGYAPLEAPFLKHLDLDVAPGRRIALVGPSGSGKSTVGRLLVGLYRPRDGTINLGDRPLADWPTPALTARVAYVDQQITLFEGTVRENLTLWDDTVPERDVVAAARTARIHDVIASRPGGYDAWVEEGGRNWSGGQRQRLDLARALVTRPTLLVLDEATSALDPVTEVEVLDAMRGIGITCVVIAHRLSAIRDCDEIVVLERGRVVARGDHTTLLADAGGLYRRLVEA